MPATHLLRPMLLVAASVLLCLVVSRAIEHGDLGLTATVRASHVELRLKLAAFCVRMDASLPGRWVASANLFTCDDCLRPRPRFWS